MTTPSVGPSPNVAVLRDRLAQMEAELASKRKQIATTNVLTVVVAVVVLVLLGIFFNYGHREFTKVTEPKELTRLLQGQVDSNLPTIHKELADQVKKQAPVMATELSKTIVSSIPSARKELEKVIMTQFDNSMTDASLFSEENFQKFLKDHRAEVEQAYKDLATSDKISDASLKAMEDSLDKELEASVKQQAAALLQSLDSFVAHLKRLEKNEKLTEDEKAQRHLWMVVKRLQKEEIDPSMKELFPAPEEATEAITKKPQENSKDKPKVKDSSKNPKGAKE